jgi:F-type H+-transporting ATPase subunit b
MANVNEAPLALEAEETGTLTAEEHGEEVHHAEPMALGLAPGGWVGLAMLLFILILVWKGVHRLILGGLDSKIAAIRENLDEAKKLREEAEALRAEYTAKISNAEKDAEAMLEHAKSEADAIVKKATADTKAMISRREKMAADKIAAAERQAVDDLRAKAVDASASAAKALIVDKHDAAADAALADKVISNI